MADFRKPFMAKALHQMMQESIRDMRIIAKRLKIGVTDEGIQSLAYRQYANGAGESAALSFKEYLRMVDMGAGKSHPLGGLSNTLITLQSRNKSGINQVKDRTRAAKKFYSKTVYGKLTGLQNQLLYGYTEEAIEMLKKELSQASQPISN